MNVLHEQSIGCPYCGEAITVLVDCSESDQTYVEDCQVCCRPMVVAVQVEGDSVDIVVKQENE